jgi:hypothetical protein
MFKQLRDFYLHEHIHRAARNANFSVPPLRNKRGREKASQPDCEMTDCKKKHSSLRVRTALYVCSASLLLESSESLPAHQGEPFALNQFRSWPRFAPPPPREQSTGITQLSFTLCWPQLLTRCWDWRPVTGLWLIKCLARRKCIRN